MASTEVAPADSVQHTYGESRSATRRPSLTPPLCTSGSVSVIGYRQRRPINQRFAANQQTQSRQGTGEAGESVAPRRRPRRRPNRRPPPTQDQTELPSAPTRLTTSESIARQPPGAGNKFNNRRQRRLNGPPETPTPMARLSLNRPQPLTPQRPRRAPNQRGQPNDPPQVNAPRPRGPRPSQHLSGAQSLNPQQLSSVVDSSQQALGGGLQHLNSWRAQQSTTRPRAPCRRGPRNRRSRNSTQQDPPVIATPPRRPSLPSSGFTRSPPLLDIAPRQLATPTRPSRPRPSRSTLPSTSAGSRIGSFSGTFSGTSPRYASQSGIRSAAALAANIRPEGRPTREPPVINVRECFGRRGPPSWAVHLPCWNWTGDNHSPTDSECVICYEAYRIGDMCRTLPCLHTFHKDCIDEWLWQAPTCPCDRRHIPTLMSHQQDIANGRNPGSYTTRTSYDSYSYRLSSVDEDSMDGSHQWTVRSESDRNRGWAPSLVRWISRAIGLGP
eukprot:Blabericola_migrator_1__12935@NODE_853_length_6253_cov_534_155512_g604_i0_p1_GENE_NODE_853_length_6253_cov_534_155512_g604_i0NODE_853_length_6253_cov_534_155512_g604_i0_p1_ORF_typecomplete_len498_score35_08zfRING_2/PF13639_6/1_5e12zfC3HC4_2/PF13923_6/2_2e08zfRING_11/PF17123_5/4_6e08zfC3HC4_3/PF13920_6/8_2e06zfrbx1/PF12678_7/1_9e05zfC3HC4/PF00097_25/3_4e05zfRING_UBOX/PF13445_6/4_7e05zfRING_5/PF14634_6/0_0003FANCL_C/PF11793_8/0_0013Zn_ribbon_17/PF17120_5/3_6e03Zn_ribbon_17/PF17120_5/0_00087ProkRIN